MNTITARTTLAGLHAWPDAPAHRAYLANTHRHLFLVKVTLEVDHHERDVEFHDLAEHAQTLLAGLGTTYHPRTTLIDFGARSCETLADQIATLLERDGYQVATVTVSEDGENDSTIIR